MARRKITKPSAGKLTPKQLKFCEGILAGLSLRKAYRAAYDCSRSADTTVDVNASRLRADAKIALWLDSIHTSSAVCTRQEHGAELARLRNISIRTGNLGAAVQAEQCRGKMAGHYVEQYADITATQDPIAMLNKLATINVDRARQLAASLNIPWAPDTILH